MQNQIRRAHYVHPNTQRVFSEIPLTLCAPPTNLGLLGMGPVHMMSSTLSRKTQLFLLERNQRGA